MANRISVIIDVAAERATRSIDHFKRSVSEAEGFFGKLRAGGGAAMDGLRQNAAVAGPAIGAAMLQGAQVAIAAASDLEESINAVNVTFGDAADGIHALGEQSVESFGLSRAAFNGAAVQFSAFAKQVAGPGGDVAATMDDLMTRAVDFASVMNLDVSEAMAVFQSSLAGETEPIRRYGKDLSAAAVEQHALATGLIRTKSEMTEAIKVQARYSLLMESTSDVAGDFANTSDSLANQQRKLQAAMTDFAAEVGTVLVPAMESATGVANDLFGALDKIGGVGQLFDVGFDLGFLGILGDYNDAVIGFATDVAEGDQALEGFAERARALIPAAQESAAELERMAAIADRLSEAQRRVNNRTFEYERAAKEIRSELDLTLASIEEQREAVLEWEESIAEATTSGAESFADFQADAETSTEDFVADLQASAGEITNWQNNLIAVAARTSPEFAAYLAEMGAAGAPMVADLAGDEALLAQAFDGFVAQAAAMNRDMTAEFGRVAPNAASRLAALDGAARNAVVSARLTGLAEAHKSTAIGSAMADGMTRGINDRAWAAANAAAELVRKAAEAARRVANIRSPSRLFAEQVGEPIAEGVAMGIGNAAGAVDDAVAELVTPGAFGSLSVGGVGGVGGGGRGVAMAGGGGGMVVNVTVNAGMGTDANDVGRRITEILNEYRRNGGQGLV